MKRQTKPYFKKSHRAFYVNLNGKPIRPPARRKATRRRWKPISGSWPGLATERRPDRGGAHAPLHSLARTLAAGHPPLLHAAVQVVSGLHRGGPACQRGCPLPR